MSQHDFDTLAKNAAGNDMQALDRLWSAVFGLKEFLFIARGQSPNIRPYIGYKDGNQPMIFVFTDADRLEAMARELKLLSPDGQVPVMSMPTKSVVAYLTQFAQYGVKGVWFNPNGTGFFSPLENLPGIKSRADALNTV